MGLLWTGQPKQTIYDILARTRVERVVPEPTPPAWGRAIGAAGTVILFMLFAGGLVWWADKVAAWIAGRP